MNEEQQVDEQATSTPAETPDEQAASSGEESTAPKKTRRTKSAARKTRSVELTLTVTGTLDGEWQAELVHSGKRIVQGLPIPASAVSQAAAALHEEISKAIDGLLQEAREQHEAKLAELEAEVERVRKALSDLEG